jgi:Ca2+-binding RTX toxin-like protein
MADFASIIGGNGTLLDFSDVPRGADAFYQITSDLPVLNLSIRTGDSYIEASGNPNDLHLFLGKGDDTVHTGSGDDIIFGTNGDEVIKAGDGANFAFGGKGDDSITAESGSDTLIGGDGNDTLSGGDGRDYLVGSKGDDLLIGGNGRDVLLGDQGDDALYGGTGNDVLLGGDGTDLLNGSTGNDTLFGGNRHDTLSGGQGDDDLYGGGGHNTFFFGDDFGHDWIADFGHGDQIMMTSNINGSGITTPNDLAPFISGNHNLTKITIGENTIMIQGVDKDAFLHDISNWVKIV